LLAESLTHGHAVSQSKAAGVTSLDDAISQYLSPMHRDNPGAGCFMAALGCDMPRQSKEVRASFTEIVRKNVMSIARLLPIRRKQRGEDEVLATVATMVGAMVLARAVDDSTLSNRILSAARTQLIEQK
jgi:TetR/AcrR family transcriptional repressor of nem operon